jgi:hypothetical protein
VGAAERALVLGIGGGGDVVGSLAVARRCEALGTEFVLGGVSWERLPIDPLPGPRPMAEIEGGERVGDHAVLAGPETTTVQGIPFSESHVAAHLATRTVLIDITDGPVGAAEGIASAATALGCDLVVSVDIGGDAIAGGSEPGLASPLCDSVMLAAAQRLAPRLAQAGVVLGSACDGELSHAEVMARIAALASAGAWTGTFSVATEQAGEIERAAEPTGTEASLCVARAAGGEHGEIEIRGGRRTVMLSPLCAIAFCFDPVAAEPALPLTRAVHECKSLEAAHEALVDAGVSTELSYERGRAAAG